MKPETENAHWLRLWRETQERIAKTDDEPSDPVSKVVPTRGAPSS